MDQTVGPTIEPGTPDTALLIRRAQDNMITALMAGGSQSAGARVERQHGIALIASGLPLHLFNVVLIDSDTAPRAAIESAVAILRDRGGPFAVALRRIIDDPYLPLVRELGLEPMSERPWMPGMAMFPLPPTDDAATQDHGGLEIRVVTDERGIADHIAAGAAGFEIPIEWMERIVGADLLTVPGATLYAGYVDGIPVTSGLGVMTGRTIGVYNIATAEAARRRGFGATMTMRIVNDGAAAGCDVAILQASDMGRSVYERLGFRTVVDYDAYVDPTAPEVH